MKATNKTPNPTSTQGVEIAETIEIKDVESSTPGRMLHLRDNVEVFIPYNQTGKTLYTETLSETKAGNVKMSDKSVLLRVQADRNCSDLRGTLFSNVLGLLNQMPFQEGTKLELPDLTQLVGQTQHSMVFLHDGHAKVITEIAFDEPNPQVADIVSHASAEQLKYIQQFMQPDAVFLQEAAVVCQLIRLAKEKQAGIENSIKKSNRKKISKR